jgi:hypothetical protein
MDAHIHLDIGPTGAFSIGENIRGLAKALVDIRLGGETWLEGRIAADVLESGGAEMVGASATEDEGEENEPD